MNELTKKKLSGGHNILIMLRILMGLAGGTTLPAITVLLAAWVPQNERGKLGALVLGGTQVLRSLLFMRRNINFSLLF